MGAQIEINRLELDDLTRRTAVNKACESFYHDLLEEVLQSDFEQPSIPEVILAVITELTSPPKGISPYYSQVHQSVRSTSDAFSARSFRRRTIRTTRRFIGPDGQPEEIVTMKTVEPLAEYSSRSSDR